MYICTIHTKHLSKGERESMCEPRSILKFRYENVKGFVLGGSNETDFVFFLEFEVTD